MFTLEYKYKNNNKVDVSRPLIGISKNISSEFKPIFNKINDIENYRPHSNNYLNILEQTKLIENCFNDIDINIIKSKEFINYYYWVSNLSLTKLTEKLITDSNKNVNTFINKHVDKRQLTIIHLCCNNNCQEIITFHPNSRADKNEYLKIIQKKSTSYWMYRYENIIICNSCKESIEQEKDNQQKLRKKLIEEKEILQINEKLKQVNLLKTMPYKDYLETDHWKSKRKQALYRAKYKCQLCSSKENLNVHHNTYENKGEERDEDLIVLCQDCHGKFHDIFNSIKSIK